MAVAVTYVVGGAACGGVVQVHGHGSRDLRSLRPIRSGDEITFEGIIAAWQVAVGSGLRWRQRGRRRRRRRRCRRATQLAAPQSCVNMTNARERASRHLPGAGGERLLLPTAKVRRAEQKRQLIKTN